MAKDTSPPKTEIHEEILGFDYVVVPYLSSVDTPMRRPYAVVVPPALPIPDDPGEV